MMLAMAPLFSGSSGNSVCIYSDETSILVDAGVSGIKIINELKRAGVVPESLAGILITHEHDDHIKGVGILSRKLDIPIYATASTWEAMESKLGSISLKNIRIFDKQQDFYIGNMNIRAFSIPHDAADPVGYVIESGGSSTAIATDIGKLKRSWLNAVNGADTVLLESNYDLDMLTAGPYPYNLKHRVMKSHLCNDAAGEAAYQLICSGAKRIILGHLSKENNFPELALRSCESSLISHGVHPGSDADLCVASRDGITGIFEICSSFI